MSKVKDQMSFMSFSTARTEPFDTAQGKLRGVRFLCLATAPDRGSIQTSYRMNRFLIRFRSPRRPNLSGMTKSNGFTLIELMIAMVVFVIFITVMFSTYLYIARAQRDANEERKAIEEAQFLLDEMVRTVRAGTVDYSCYDAGDVCGILPENGHAGDVLAIRLQDTGERVLFKKDSAHALTVENSSGLKTLSHEKITIERLEFLITPSADPYTNVSFNQFQYQPRVSIFMEMKAPARSRPDGIRIPVQTTVSSRFYSR